MVVGDEKMNLKTENYSEFVGLIKERNRPSGGIRTIQNVAVNARIDSSKKMLEVGSNTGFTCVNMSLLTSCKSVGVDINEDSVSESKSYAKLQGVDSLTEFVVADAENLPFENDSFDVVWCSNVTSFIKNKQSAINEYLRVLKPKGTLVVVPIYYRETPPNEILDAVSTAVGTKIEVWDKYFWRNLFESVSKKVKTPIELYYDADFKYLDRKLVIDEYVAEILKKDHLNSLSDEYKVIVTERVNHFMSLFNENLKYAGFTIFLFQKRNLIDEMELFLSEPN